MKLFTSFAALGLLVSSAAATYYGNTTTVAITTTDFVTTCPYPTTFTVSTCTNHVCSPSIVTVTSATTLTITGEVICPTGVVSSEFPSEFPSSVESSEEEETPSGSEGSVITTQVTVTDYTTYCPYPTTITVTTCENHKCGETVIPVETATTITVTGEVLCPTTTTAGPTTTTTEAESSGEVETTSKVLTTYYTTTDYTTYCPYPTTLTVSTCDEKNVTQPPLKLLLQLLSPSPVPLFVQLLNPLLSPPPRLLRLLQLLKLPAKLLPLTTLQLTTLLTVHPQPL